MSYRELFMEENADGMEMFNLAYDRIKEIESEETVEEKYRPYFKKMADFIIYMSDIMKISEYDGIREKSLEELQEVNRNIFESVIPKNYDNSFLNPDYMVTQFGETYGQYLCYLAATIRQIIPYAFSFRVQQFTIYMNYFIEIYNIFEGESELVLQQLKDSVYWFESDYSDIFLEQRIREQYDVNMNFYRQIVEECDLSDARYLYFYGRYVSENEIKVSKYLCGLSDAEIDSIARTYTEGFRKGFVLGKKDITKKKFVEIRYAIGFERVVRAAIKQFKEMGLEVTIRNAVVSGTMANKQMAFDHKFDQALYLDKALVDRKLSVVRVAFEKYKEQAGLMAGPACIETFGENPFTPEIKKTAPKLNEKQRKLSAGYDGSYIQIFREYQKSEDTSFTIIAYPIPEIGDNFEVLFDETIAINNLDDKLYLGIQQKLIDALDEAEYVHVLGTNGNKTDIKVSMNKLKDKTKETNFENCLADVNIPLGEVFTSPVLKGTNGTLNVSEVYLDDLKYTNLTIEFVDGMVKDYTCDNYEDKEQCKRFIKENLLKNRDTLPIGEFAIGTNTTAYVMAKKYDIVYKLPILIVEKMGPHFAIGDTCYSYEEDVMTYNPDGKAIVARENEISAKRHDDIKNAYMGVHTDITIPYDELLEISAVKPNGDRVKILENGRFVLEGTERLNDPFSK